MAAGAISKLSMTALASPLIGLSLVLEVLAPRQLLADMEACSNQVAATKVQFPDALLDALIAAEDHRNKQHPGVDVIAMVRATWVRVTSGKIQGASTIQQQFVRVVTQKSDRTCLRKLREQMLALMLSRRIPRRKIAEAYLAIAFYGSGRVGTDGLKKQLGDDFTTVTFEEALWTMVQLKYPRPVYPTQNWEQRIADRYAALKRRNGMPITSNANN